jgi:hypothetical protein
MGQSLALKLIRSRGSRISRLKLFRHRFLSADDASQRAE